MQSITHSRLDAHDSQISQILSETTKSKHASTKQTETTSAQFLVFKSELDNLESIQHKAQISVKEHGDVLEGHEFRLSGLSQGFTKLSHILNDELERVRSDYDPQLVSISDQMYDVKRTNESLRDEMSNIQASQTTLHSQTEESVNRMRTQMNQQRIELDDMRRQSAVLGNIQTVVSEMNDNQRELAGAVAGLQQSFVYISEWVQTLRTENADLRHTVSSLQSSQSKSTSALAGDVLILSEDIAGLRAKHTSQHACIANMSENVERRINGFNQTVSRALDGKHRWDVEKLKEEIVRIDERHVSVVSKMEKGQVRLESLLIGQSARVSSFTS